MKRRQIQTYKNDNTYTEYLGLKRLSTASTVMSLKNRFIVNTSMKYKIFEKLKSTCDGEHDEHEEWEEESGFNHAQIKASTKINKGRITTISTQRHDSDLKYSGKIKPSLNGIIR